jgi:hypothetical protein
MTSAPTAIRLGFTQTASRWATSLFAALASIAEALAGITAMLGALAWLDDRERSGVLAFGAAIAGVLAARILLTLVQGGAVRQSGAWLGGQSSGSTMEEILAAAPRALGWFAWTLPIEALAALWKWVGLAAVLYGYGHAVSARHGGCSAALAFSAFTCIAVLLGLGWAALSRATLVWTVRRQVGPFRASAAAFTALLERPGSFFLVLVVGLVGAAVVTFGIGLFASGLTPDQQDVEEILMGQLATGVLIAFGSALFDLVILYGFTALEADPAVGTTPTATGG